MGQNINESYYKKPDDDLIKEITDKAIDIVKKEFHQSLANPKRESPLKNYQYRPIESERTRYKKASFDAGEYEI